MQSWGLTDQGCVRKQNQDTYQIEKLDRNSVLCVVCDGMGGAKSGNIASTLAVDVFVQEVRQSWKSHLDQGKIDQILRSAVKLANFTVFDQSQQFPEFDGMGTTLVAVLIHGRKATVVNVGDSRAYGIDRSGIRQITKDHSYVEEMVRMGKVDRADARTHEKKNVITRAVGATEKVKTDIFEVDLEDKDTVLMCTDGLSNMVTDERILEIVLSSVHSEDIARKLVDEANKNGGQDNITVLVSKPYYDEVK